MLNQLQRIIFSKRHPGGLVTSRLEALAVGVADNTCKDGCTAFALKYWAREGWKSHGSQPNKI